jgi:histidine triad (HIT) family protein
VNRVPWTRPADNRRDRCGPSREVERFGWGPEDLPIKLLVGATSEFMKTDVREVRERPADLSPAERRWLYERLVDRADHEDELLDRRLTFFSGLTAALVAAELIELYYHVGRMELLGSRYGPFSNSYIDVVPPCAIVLSMMWAFLMARTTIGQHIYRGAIRDFEVNYPLFEDNGTIAWRPTDPDLKYQDEALNLAWPITLLATVLRERPTHNFWAFVSPNTLFKWLALAFAVGWASAWVVDGGWIGLAGFGTIGGFLAIAYAWHGRETKRRSAAEEWIHIRKPSVGGVQACPFCEFVRDTSSPPIFHEGASCVAMVADSAMSEGHSLIVPKRHVERFAELTELERAELMEISTTVIRSITDVMRKRSDFSGDFNICLNDGAVAGQRVPHLHFHVVPRYPTGDGPVTPGASWGQGAPRTRLSSESIEQSAGELRAVNSRISQQTRGTSQATTESAGAAVSESPNAASESAWTR